MVFFNECHLSLNQLGFYLIVFPAANLSAMGTPSHGYDPRESVYAAKLQDLHKPAVPRFKDPQRWERHR